MPIIPSENPQPWSPPAWLVEKREYYALHRDEINARRREKYKNKKSKI